MVAEEWEAEAERLRQAWCKEAMAATTTATFHRYSGGADALLTLMHNMARKEAVAALRLALANPTPKEG